MSLRDVERAMIVFEYFYDKMVLFAPLMNKKANNKLIGVESDDQVSYLFESHSSSSLGYVTSNNLYVANMIL